MAGFLFQNRTKTHALPHYLNIMISLSIQRYNELKADSLNFRRLTGITKDEFDSLHVYFSRAWEDYFSNYTLEGVARIRKNSNRKNSIFGTSQDVLLFALVYLKGGIRQEQLAAHFGIDQPKTSKYLGVIKRVLVSVLEQNPRAITKRKKDQLLEAIVD